MHSYLVCDTTSWSYRDGRRFVLTRLAAVATVLIVAAALAACSSSDPKQAASSDFRRVDEARVLLLEPDVEAAQITAFAGPQLNAIWTAAARRNITNALERFLADRNAVLVPHDPSTVPVEEQVAHEQIIKLHETVTLSINNFQDRLPTKQGQLNWTLGEGVGLLREHYDTDYVLSVYLRDSTASSGRVTLGVLLGMLGANVNPADGRLLGIATLTDLQTGRVIWFNRYRSESGDLRSPEPAAEVVDELMSGFPL